jgi:HK97 family phage portal protein
MGLLSRAFRLENLQSFAPVAVPTWQAGISQFNDGKFESFARQAYQANELVYAGIEELSTSAAEPKMRAKIGNAWRDSHAILDLLNLPNPFMDRFTFWANVIMNLYIGGNAYAVIVRSKSGRPLELWLMRPDLVTIVPSAVTYIDRYEYRNGGDVTRLPVGDVIHWKLRNPLDQFYGQSPLLAGAGRIDVDNYMKQFTSTFFAKAGIPAGMLNVEGSTTPEFKKEVRERFSREFGGPNGWHGIMVVDGKKASFTPMTQNLGNSGLVVPELDEISEARILMLLGVPPELVGARSGMQNSSYANKRAARESFWDETLMPLYQMMVGPINLRLVPDFPGVKEVEFDLSGVRALQEDVDKIHARWRADLISGGCTIEEFRLATGKKAQITEGTYLIPSNLVPVPAAMVAMGEIEPPKPAAPAQIAAPMPDAPMQPPKR